MKEKKLTSKPPLLGSLTALRFFAAIGIVLQHAASFMIPREAIRELPTNYGVTFFFVLSGFILTYNYAENPIHLRQFYIARIARIFPLSIFSVFLAFIFIPHNVLVPFIAKDNTLMRNIFAVGTNFTLTQSLIPSPDFYFGTNSVLWSVSTELFFYLLFPLLILLTRKKWTFILSGIGVILISLFMVYLTYYLDLPSYVPGIFQINSHGLTHIHPLSRLKEFFLGILLGKLFLYSRNHTLFSKLFSKLPHPKLTVIFSLFEVLSLWIVCSQLPSINHFFSNQVSYQPARVAISHFLGGSLFAIMIFIFAFQKGLISRFLSLPPWILLGEISFSIYISHQIILRMLLHFYSIDVLKEMLWSFPIFMMFTVFISYLLWCYVENPSRKFIRKVFSDKQKAL